MQKVDFYSGEPSVDGSPPITQNEAIIAAAQMQYINQYVQQQKQTNSGYSYDPIARQAMQFPQGGGYSSPFQYQQPYQPMGIGYPAAPSYYNPNYPQQQYFNPYQQMQQSIFDQQPVARTIDIAGYDPSGSEFLFTTEMIERLEQMKLEYVAKRREIEVENQSINNGYNYYGSPFYTGVYFKIRELDSQFYQEIEKIKQEARENRKRFNLNMGRIAHVGSHEKISEEALRERYYGKQIELEAPVVQNLQ